jgi:hypothetical protein
MKRQLGAVMLGILIFASYGCGKSNIFSFAHSAGNSTGATALSSDAAQALQNKDYVKALQYYTQILQSNPGNSQAIYGYCAAELANSGMDVSTLVANLVKQQSSAPSRLAPAIAYAAHSSGNATALIPQSIIDNRVNIETTVNDVLGSKYLLKIIQGKADGMIPPDNPDVNINIAFCLVLRAALKVYDSGIIFDNQYNVTGNNNSSNMDIVNSAGKDIASAYQRLKVVAKKLNLGSDASINKISNDINTLFTQFKNQTGISFDINYDYYLNGN